MSKIKPATADDIAHGTISSRFKPQSIDDQIIQNPILPTGKPTTGSSGKSSDQFLDISGLKTGSPTTGDKGTPIQDLLKQIPVPKSKTPSKSDRKKKSDNKAPKKLNPPKSSSSGKSAPKAGNCDSYDLLLFKLQNPLCSLKNMLGLRPQGFQEQRAGSPEMLTKPEIATEGLEIPIIAP